MADTNNSANPERPPVPETCAGGLDLFVAAWLEQWTALGGDVSLFPDGRLQVGIPLYTPKGPDYEPHPDLPDDTRRDHERFNDGHFHGKVRAMFDVMKSVPMGRDALRNHMRAHGLRFLPPATETL